MNCCCGLATPAARLQATTHTTSQLDPPAPMLPISWKTAKQCVDSRQALLLAVVSMCPLIGQAASSAELESLWVSLLELGVIHATGNICIASVSITFQVPKHEAMNDYILVPTSRSSWRLPILSRRRRRRGSQLPGRRTRWSCKSMRTKWGELFSMLSPKKIRRGYRKTPGNDSEGKNERSWNLIIEFFRSQDGLSL